MNYMLQRLLDFSSYTLLTVSAATNWDTVKGNLSFFAALILTCVTLYCRYLEIRDRKRREEAEAKKENKKDE